MSQIQQVMTERQLRDAADAFVAGMDRTERVTWLQRQGFTDQQILDALLDIDDADLERFTRDAARAVVDQVVSGELDSPPAWLR